VFWLLRRKFTSRPLGVLATARHKKGRPPALLCSFDVTAYVDCDC